MRGFITIIYFFFAKCPRATCKPGLALGFWHAGKQAFIQGLVYRHSCSHKGEYFAGKEPQARCAFVNQMGNDCHYHPLHSDGSWNHSCPAIQPNWFRCSFQWALQTIWASLELGSVCCGHRCPHWSLHSDFSKSHPPCSKHWGQSKICKKFRFMGSISFCASETLQKQRSPPNLISNALLPSWNTISKAPYLFVLAIVLLRSGNHYW